MGWSRPYEARLVGGSEWRTPRAGARGRGEATPRVRAVAEARCSRKYREACRPGQPRPRAAGLGRPRREVGMWRCGLARRRQLAPRLVERSLGDEVLDLQIVR